MKFKAFIFDLDGTILDSLQDLTDSVNCALKQQNLPLRSKEEVQMLIGNGIDKLVIQSLPLKAQNNQKIIAKTLESMAQFYSTNWHINTCLYPHIADLFDRLTLQKIPMAILSNKPQVFLTQIVNHYMKKWDFVEVIGSRAAYPLKPKPNSTLAIVQKFELMLNEVALVGDGETDIKTALVAGISSIAVTWGLRTVEEQKKAGATTFIHSPMELLNFI